MTRRSLLLTASLFEGGLLLLALFIGRLTDISVRSQLTGSLIDVAYGLLATLPLLLLLALSPRLPWAPLRRLHQTVVDLVRRFFATTPLLDLLIISLLAGLGEEALFRGVLQPWFAGIFGLAPAIFLTSLFFGLAHAITPAYALMAMLMGGYFSWLTLASHSLISPILAHTLYDFVALLYLQRVVQYHNQAHRLAGADHGMQTVGDPE